MRKIFLLYLTILTLFTYGQTNVYHPFPDNNSIWNVGYSWLCSTSPYDSGGRNYSITFSNDTVIGSLTYHKLTTPFVPSFESSCWSGGIELNIYKGAIRQDTFLKKVFIVPPTYNAEQLLYDFTMQVGDTVKGYIETNASPVDIVQSIDSVLVGSSYRKRWLINFGYQIYYIEGIGSTYGLIEHSPGGTTDQLMYVTNCFQQDGQPLYPSTTTNCELITSTNIFENKGFQIKIYPNPSNGSFIVDFDKSVRKILLTDILGNVILKHQANNQTKFNIDNLSSGTYILTAIDKDGRTTKKKIISCP